MTRRESKRLLSMLERLIDVVVQQQQQCVQVMSLDMHMLYADRMRRQCERDMKRSADPLTVKERT